MTQDDFIKYSLLWLADDEETGARWFQFLKEAFLRLYIMRIEKMKTSFDSERLYYVNLLSQKFLIHCASFEKLMKDIEFKMPEQRRSVRLLDPFSSNALFRTILENYLVINYLTDRNISSDVLDGRCEIWMMYGIRQRNLLPESDEEVRIHESDIKSITELESSLKNRSFFKELSHEKEIKFFKQCRKEWKFLFEGGNYYTLSWKRLIELAGLKEDVGNQIYNYLSWHVHSHSISVLQLKDMWEDSFDKEVVKSTVNKLNMIIISFAISDITYADAEFASVFKDLDEETRNLIIFQNYAFRTESYH